jgi:hypothetical protein
MVAHIKRKARRWTLTSAGHSGYIGVALGWSSLNFYGALGCLQSALELDQKRVANRFDFRAVKARKN